MLPLRSPCCSLPPCSARPPAISAPAAAAPRRAALYCADCGKSLRPGAQVVALRLISSTEAALIFALEPVTGAAFAYCLLGERCVLRTLCALCMLCSLCALLAAACAARGCLRAPLLGGCPGMRRTQELCCPLWLNDVECTCLECTCLFWNTHACRWGPLGWVGAGVIVASSLATQLLGGEEEGAQAPAGTGGSESKLV